MYNTIDELQQATSGALCPDNGLLRVVAEVRLRESLIDPLVFTAVFAGDARLRTQARSLIRQLAATLGIRSGSLRRYYLAIGAGNVSATSTVPAINIRAMTYDVACILFKLQRERGIGPLIFEIARSEMAYTDQRPDVLLTLIETSVSPHHVHNLQAVERLFQLPGYDEGKLGHDESKQYRTRL